MKMIRIGIIGSDNSHARRFSDLINIDNIFNNKCVVSCIYGIDKSKTQEVARLSNIQKICYKINDLLDLVDAVIIVDRNGDLHLKHALPFIKNKIPTFIDKPLAISLHDCDKLINESNKFGTLLTSFSPLRVSPSIDLIIERIKYIGEINSSNYVGPCDFKSIYGGPFFYATHLYEIARKTLNENIKSLSAKEINGNVNVNIFWKSGKTSNFTYLNNSHYVFHTTIFGKEGYISEEVIGGHFSYTNLLRIFIDMIDSKIKPLTDYELIEPIKFVHSINKSLEIHGDTIFV